MSAELSEIQIPASVKHTLTIKSMCYFTKERNKRQELNKVIQLKNTNVEQ